MNSITVNHIVFYGVKELDIISNICAICQENITESCNKCIQDHNIKCYSVIGVCKHAYHYCCINDWITRQSLINIKCPMCNQKWELKKRSIN